MDCPPPGRELRGGPGPAHLPRPRERRPPTGQRRPPTGRSAPQAQRCIHL